MNLWNNYNKKEEIMSTILRMHISAPKAIESTKVIFMNCNNLSQKELVHLRDL